MKLAASAQLSIMALLSLLTGSVLAVSVPIVNQAPLVGRDTEPSPESTSLQCPAIKRFVTTEVYRRCLFIRVNILSSPLQWVRHADGRRGPADAL